MSRPPIKSVEDKLRIVLAVLRGEVSMKEAARRERVSETSIAAWRDQFLDGGRAGLAGGARHGPSSREAESTAQIDELTSALVELTWSFACGAKGGGLPSLQELKVIREDAGMSVARFVALLGMPRATWYRWRAAVGADLPAKVPWPAPVVEAIQPLAASTPRRSTPGATARSGGCCGPTGSSPASPRCGGGWAAEGCCSRRLPDRTRQLATAREQRSCTARCNRSGRPTSAN